MNLIKLIFCEYLLLYWFSGVLSFCFWICLRQKNFSGNTNRISSIEQQRQYLLCSPLSFFFVYFCLINNKTEK